MSAFDSKGVANTTNPRFALDYCFTTDNLQLKIPMFAGCNCAKLDINTKLYYHDEDCYGFASTTANVALSNYLSVTYSTQTFASVQNFLKKGYNGTGSAPLVRAVRGAVLYVQEAKNVYNAILNGLPC